MASIFKAYDIRGIYGTDLTPETACDIGRAFVAFLKCKRVVVGRDMRPHSAPLFDGLARGLTMQGADVVNIGLCSTPMSYYANGSLGADASVMITASHNPGEWNGFKLCRSQAVPISGQTGIKDIERRVAARDFPPPEAKPGTVIIMDIGPAYAAHVRGFFDLSGQVRIAADFANAMGVYEARALNGLVRVDSMFDTLDGTFPNHEANPLKAETLVSLQQRVRSGGYDFGVAFDGDSDRVGFVDEKGAVVPMDMITALIAQSVLGRQKGKILYDLRSSWSVREVIGENGGIPMMCRVGHAFIKQQMRAENALFAGELSGHYYFRDNFFTESAAMAVLRVAEMVAKLGRPLSELVRPLCRYAKSPELNLEVRDAAAVFRALQDRYKAGRTMELDGLSVEFPDWWFNIRSSNTEPLVRVNLEARTADTLAERQRELLDFIRTLGS